MSSPSPPPYAAANHLGPYLRLPHRLSLAPFAYPIIAVAFVALRFYLSLRSAKNLIGDAKQLVIAGCLGAQKAATAAVSLPRWMALETNEQLVNVGLETIDAARVGLNLSLTAMDKIIVFLIDSYRSFYQCMGEFLIRGGLAAIITISQYVENGLNSLGSQITTAVNAAQSGLNTVIGNANSLFSSVPGFGSVSIPQLSVPVNSLSITVPDTVSSTLTNLNNSLPTLDQLRQDIANLISTPFTLLQGQINDTFAHIENSTFSSDLLPVPAVRTIEFCDGIDLSVIDKVGNKLITIVQDMAIFLVVLVFIMMVGNVILEWYRWRSLQAAVGSISDSWTDPSAPEGQRPVPVVELTHDNILVLQSQLDHGFKTKYLAMFRRKFNLHPRTTNGLSWFFAYVTYPPALMCFLIGVLGLIVVFVQLALIGPLEAEFDNLENLVIGNYTAEIADAINHAITVDTAAYATAVNGWMDTTQNGINNQVFGFVSTASNAINGTVVRFYDDIENGIQSALSGTVFADAVIQFLRCVIGNKILSLEAGLTWLNAHMHISLPHVDPAFLTVKASSVLEMAAPINAAANTQDTSGSDESGILGHIIVAYKDILKGEAILFGVFLGLWFLVVLEACIIMIWHKISDSRKAKQAAAEESHMTKEPEMTEKTASPA